MTALSTFLGRLLFAGTCVLGWAVFPLLIGAGVTGLFGYALVVEFLSTLVGAVAPAYADHVAARRTADRLCRSPEP